MSDLSNAETTLDDLLNVSKEVESKEPEVEEVKMDNGPSYRDLIRTQGYVLIKDLFPKELLHELRSAIMQGIRRGKFGLRNKSGIIIPNFLKVKDLRDLGLSLKHNEKLHAILKDIFGGDDYRFCAHNDVGVNRTVAWHKDRLNGKYRKFEKHDIFAKTKGETFQIVKVLTYLESHEDDDHALMLIPGSHVKRKMGNPKDGIRMHPSFGDTLIFDQRISHKGQGSKVTDSSKRILVSLGFGKNNHYTDEFEKGTKHRQRDQFKEMMKGK